MLQYFKKCLLCVFAFLFAPNLSLAAVGQATAEVNPASTGGGGGSSFGSGSGYQPISGMSFGGNGFGGILEQLFIWGVTMTIILAVIMLVVGGVQYMGSESLFGKDEGKKRIVAALGGLLIALMSIFILNLILGSGGQGPFNV